MIFKSEDLKFERAALWTIKLKITFFQKSFFPHEHNIQTIARKKLDVTYVVCPFPTLLCLMLSFLDFCDAVILAKKLWEQARQLKIPDF